MITNRIRVRIKQGSTSTTVVNRDGELNVTEALSAEVTALLNKRVGPDVQAIYVEVITK